MVDRYQKLLIKDPSVAVPNKKNEPYVLRDEPVKPEQEILRIFMTRRDRRINHIGRETFDLLPKKRIYKLIYLGHMS